MKAHCASLDSLPPGTVIWITGLSGAGKSTVARALVERLKERGIDAILLDGDEFRQAVAEPTLGHDRESRLANAMRISRFAELLSNQGFPVVVATMSLFEEIFKRNRERLRSYFEVYLKVPVEVLESRDARGLYSKAKSGEAKNVVGIHLDYDEPSSPTVIIENSSELANPSSLAEKLLDKVTEWASQSNGKCG